MLSDLFVMLFLVAMVIFIVYHFYVDYSNWSNTGNTFAEGMENPSDEEANTTDAPVNNETPQEVMNRQTQSRTGISDPMESSVPQNCKPGCVAPNGPSGNCKNIQQQGNPKKSCPYTCFNPTLEPNKCQYEQDCNSCGTRIFNPDDEPNMPPTAPEITGQPGGTFQDLRNKSNLNTCLLYTSPSPRDQRGSRMPSSA